jgi:hypothetical protein
MEGLKVSLHANLVASITLIVKTLTGSLSTW